MNKRRLKQCFNKAADTYQNYNQVQENILGWVLNLISTYSNIHSIVDIGCGSGRLCYLLAKENPSKVVGVDYSQQMIDIAKEFVKNKGHEEKIQFECVDFFTKYQTNEKFDISIALGVFDYLQFPEKFLEKMKSVTKGKIIASYPARYAFQAPIRRVWLYTRKCPVYFYTESRLQKIYESVGLKEIKIIKTPLNSVIPTGYVVSAKV